MRRPQSGWIVVPITGLPSRLAPDGACLMSLQGGSCMKMMLKSSIDDTSIDSSSKLFLFTFRQNI